MYEVLVLISPLSVTVTYEMFFAKVCILSTFITLFNKCSTFCLSHSITSFTMCKTVAIQYLKLNCTFQNVKQTIFKKKNNITVKLYQFSFIFTSQIEYVKCKFQIHIEIIMSITLKLCQVKSGTCVWQAACSI